MSSEVRGLTKGNEFLKFRCTSCGNCCKETIVPVTTDDVKRIMAETRQPAMEVVEFYDNSEIETNQRDRGWISLRAGRRIMGLKKKRGGCQYLKEDRCSIYEARPVTCRRYPFNLVLDETGKLQELSIHRAVKCLYELDGKQTRRELKQHSVWEDKQDDVYYAQVKAWNRRKPPGTKKQYLQHLGLLDE